MSVLLPPRGFRAASLQPPPSTSTPGCLRHKLIVNCQIGDYRFSLDFYLIFVGFPDSFGVFHEVSTSFLLKFDVIGFHAIF